MKKLNHSRRSIKDLLQAKLDKQPRSIVQIAENILNKEGRPLHYREITKRLMSYYDLHGKTPYETVRARIGTSKKFKRVAEGVYGLVEWGDYPIARFAKDIAYGVLQSRNRPMKLTQLGDSVLEERQFVGSANQIARNVVRSDKRFIYDPQSGLVSLREWKK